ncbi:MAG: hypothetical protein ACETWD_11800, partial [Desulfatiglandales bacterium]
KLELLVDRDPNIDITIDFFLDQIDTPYKTITITLDNELGKGEKIWKKVFVGTVGNFHRIRIYHNAVNQTPKFHAIVPYFRPGGRTY